MSFDFHNMPVDVDDPVESWGSGGILATLERGTIREWSRIAHRVMDDPWGPVSRDLEAVIAFSRPIDDDSLIGEGNLALMERAIERARRETSESERDTVASEIRDIVERSAISRKEFSERIGTSTSRLSTYESGKVVPSAAMMVRMRRAAASKPATDLGADT